MMSEKMDAVLDKAAILQNPQCSRCSDAVKGGPDFSLMPIPEK
jgi:hypothetical protein